MKYLVTLLSAALLSGNLFAQLSIISQVDHQDYNNSLYVTEGSASSFDIESRFWVKNTSDSTLHVTCQRLEVDVEEASTAESSFAWLVHIVYVDVGSEPIRTSVFSIDIEPNDSTYFIMHLRPNGHEGCSYYQVRWFDELAPTDIYATLDLLIDHSPGECATAIPENKRWLFEFWPNPARDEVRIAHNHNQEMTEVEISDVLGQVVLRSPARHVDRHNPIVLDTSSLKTGSYVLTILQDGRVLQAEKLLINR